MKKIWPTLSFLCFLSGQAWSGTAGNGVLVEDFADIGSFDRTASTGFWNVEDKVAEAARVAGADVARPMDFGDGSDGVLSSTTGYTFDTDAHPNGYSFVSVSISGGFVHVTGAKTLVIRSLKAVNIVPAIDEIKGGPGTGGNAGAASGGTAVTCLAVGGAAGTATGGVAGGGPGNDGKGYDGVSDAAATGGPANGGDGSASIPVAGTGADFDTPAKFVCGSGGGGGGGNSNGGGNFASGSGGGGGGGIVRIVAAGDLSVGLIDASGGAGGAKGHSGTVCSGAGAGGVGGDIWLQTLKTLSTSSDPVATGGAGGAPNGCPDTGIPGIAGIVRGDSKSGGRPAWAAGAGNYDTDNVVSSQTYYIQSKAYDLMTSNAAFVEQPEVTSVVPTGGSVAVKYAASSDGTNFSAFADNISSLSGRGYRYLKFKIAITTHSSAAPSPRVSRISVKYQELDFGVSGGCFLGTVDRNSSPRPGNGSLWAALFWMACLASVYLFVRYGLVLKDRRPEDKGLPA